MGSLNRRVGRNAVHCTAHARRSHCRHVHSCTLAGSRVPPERQTDRGRSRRPTIEMMALEIEPQVCQTKAIKSLRLPRCIVHTVEGATSTWVCFCRRGYAEAWAISSQSSHRSRSSRVASSSPFLQILGLGADEVNRRCCGEERHDRPVLAIDVAEQHPTAPTAAMSRNDSALSGRRGGGASELAEKPAPWPAAAAGLCPILRGVSQGCVSEVVCPSVCPSDWEKHETLVVSSCCVTTCDERFILQRRGQDSHRASTQVVCRSVFTSLSRDPKKTCYRSPVVGCCHGFSPVVTRFVSAGQTPSASRTGFYPSLYSHISHRRFVPLVPLAGRIVLVGQSRRVAAVAQCSGLSPTRAPLAKIRRIVPAGQMRRVASVAQCSGLSPIGAACVQIRVFVPPGQTHCAARSSGLSPSSPFDLAWTTTERHRMSGIGPTGSTTAIVPALNASVVGPPKNACRSGTPVFLPERRVARRNTPADVRRGAQSFLVMIPRIRGPPDTLCSHGRLRIATDYVQGAAHARPRSPIGR